MSVLVSYVMASFNHAEFVGAMVESVLSQTVSDLELVIVDDGSVDRSVELLRNYAQSDARIRLIEQGNQGIVAARNRGMSAARGTFVSIIDSDDVLELDRTERLLEALKHAPNVVLAYGDAWILGPGSLKKKFSSLHPRREGDPAAALFRYGCFVPACSVMFRRTTFEQSGPLWGEGSVTDYLKWIEIALLGEVSYVQGKPLATWRHHSHNLSQTSGERRAEQYLALLRDQEILLQKHEVLRRKLSVSDLSKRRAHLRFVAGYYLLLGGGSKQASECFRASMRESPSFRGILGMVVTAWPLKYVAPYGLRIQTALANRLRCLALSS